jgi:hypothetical protein
MSITHQILCDPGAKATALVSKTLCLARSPTQGVAATASCSMGLLVQLMEVLENTA